LLCGEELLIGGAAFGDVFPRSRDPISHGVPRHHGLFLVRWEGFGVVGRVFLRVELRRRGRRRVHAHGLELGEELFVVCGVGRVAAVELPVFFIHVREDGDRGDAGPNVVPVVVRFEDDGSSSATAETVRSIALSVGEFRESFDFLS